MLVAIVFTRYGAAYRFVVRVVNGIDVSHLMTIVVVGDIGGYVGLIVAQILRLRTGIPGGEIVPVVGRGPYGIAVVAEGSENRRSLHKHGLNDIGGAVDIRFADNLAVVGAAVAGFHRKGGNVLEHVVGKHGLNDEHVVVAAHHFHDAQVVHEAVTVEVEVGNHVTRRVENHLKLLHR